MLLQNARPAIARAPRATSRRVVVRAALKKEPQPQASIASHVAPTMLAALMAMSGSLGAVDAVFPSAAHADAEETMSPYQKRQAEMEKRRELLREAREKAAARAAGTAVPEAAAESPAATPAPPKPAAPKAAAPSLSYQAATKNRPPAPAPEPAMESPSFGGFSFSKPAAPEAAKPAEPAAAKKSEPSSSSSSSSSSLFSSDMFNTPIKPRGSDTPAAPAAPAPAPVAPAPFKAPQPAPPKPVVVAPKAVVVAPKPAAKAPEAPKKAAPAPANNTKPGKRRGPLPLWFAEVLMLGAYVGMFLAATKFSKQSGQVVEAAWGKVKEAYVQLEKVVGKKGPAV